MSDRPLASTFVPRASVLGAACLLLLSACESGTTARDPLDGLPAAGQIKLQLTHVDSCSELLTRVQDGFLVPLAERAKVLRSAPANGGYDYGRDDGVIAVDGDSAVPPRATPDTPQNNGGPTSAGDPGSAPSGVDTSAPRPAPSGSGEGKSGDPQVPTETPVTQPSGPFSGTTVQVQDIDEADIVKTEGDRIYVLHGGTLFVLAGWPANSTAILGSTLVEGEPTEMFVRDGKAAVFSRVYGLAAANAANDVTPTNEARYSGSQYTKLTLLDVNLETPEVLRESYIEGEYASARRHDGRVRVVVQDGFKVPQLGNPVIEYVDGFGHPYPQKDIDAQVDAWLARTERSIRSTQIGDWLPREFSKQGGQLVSEQPRCGDYYAPDAGLADSSVTSIVSFDLDAATAPFSGATILGRAERVYANEQVLLLTQTDYRYQYATGQTEQTIIHRFDIEGSDISYVASGAVPGMIHDQFSLDERDGVIRVSTTEERFGAGQGGVGVGTANPVSSTTPPVAVDLPAVAPPGNSASAPGGTPQPDPKTAPSEPSSELVVPEPAPDTPVARPPAQGGPVNRVLTLGTKGDELLVLGSTENFGFNERIYSTRFIGDRGYVVTFRRTDPLFVVDLSDPAHPTVVGDLEIPGFSDYLFPLDDDHLFAIGQDADANGVVRGIALQIFDVSDATQPALTHRYVLPELGASPANIDHRAISFHPSGNVVAFPYQSYETGESSLQVFRVSAEDGVAPLGGMTEDLDLEQCLTNYGYPPETLALIEKDPSWQTEVVNSCRWGHQFKRGLFRDDFVYGISDTGVYAYDLAAMAAGAVGQVSLPAAVYDYGSNQGGPLPTPGNVKPPSVGTTPTTGSAGMTSAGAGGASGTPAAAPPADPVAPEPANDPDRE